MDSALQFVQSPLWAPVVLPALILIVIFVCWLRAGSAYMLLDWLWRLFRVRAAVRDENLKTFIQQNSELVRLRFIYGITLDSFAEMQRLLAWANRHSVSAIELKQCRNWITLGPDVAVATPSRRRVATLLAGCVLVTLLLYVPISGGVISMRYAVLRTTVTKRLFLTDGVILRPIGGAPVSSDDCTRDIPDLVKTMRFTRQEATVTCQALGGAEFRGFTSAVRYEQELVCLLVSALLLYIAWCLRAGFLAAAVALKVSRRLAARHEAPSSLPAVKEALKNHL
jgi:Family of unknown function (DUF6216)